MIVRERLLLLFSGVGATGVDMSSRSSLLIFCLREFRGTLFLGSLMIDKRSILAKIDMVTQLF